MPHALVIVAQWVGSAIGSAAAAAGASAATAATVASLATAATYAAEIASIYSVSKALQPKVGGNYGSQVDFKADPQAGIPYAVGRTGVAGNIVFAQTAGAKNSWLSYVTVYTGAGPIDSYESFSVNGAAITFGTDSGEGASGYYQNRMWRLSQLGASPESSYLHPTATGTKDTPADHSGFPSEWSSTHKISGYAADLWILQYNTDKYSAGTPQRMTVGKWVKAYDPRLDSTYPGGSGSHRSNNEATWAWTANPYLHAIAWLLGRYQNGVRVLGCGLPTTLIDMAAFVEGANVADTNIWKVGGVVYSTDNKWEVLKAFLQAGGGKPMQLGMKVSCLVNTPRTSLATLTKADVVGPVRITSGQRRRDRINTVWPKYREEAQNWQMVALDAPVSVSTYVTEDGSKVRSRTLEYPLVQSANQVAQLAYYDIADGREIPAIVLPCKPIWMGMKPGDCITANEPEWGLNSQDVLILKRTRDPATMKATFICRSETTAKHAAALGKTGTAPSTPGLTAYDPNNFAAPGSGIYTCSGVTLTASGATNTAPALRVAATTNAPDNYYAVSLLVRYRVNGTSAWSYLSAPIGVDKVDITGVIAGVAYDVEVGYRSARGTESGYTACAGGPFTAGSLTSSNRVFDNSRPGSPIAGDVNVIKDGSGRVIALETYVSGAWLQSSTNNKVTFSTSAPATPTVNDIWVVLSGTTPVAYKAWNGSAWVVVADLTSVNVASGYTGQTAWGTFPDSGVNDPAYVAGQLTWLDFNGRITDWRGFPVNAPIGYGGARTTWALTSTGTSITVTAYTEYRTGSNIAVATGTASGLSNDTEYDVFLFLPSTIIAVDLSLSYNYIIDIQNYVYLGRQATKTAGGTYSATPAPPGGSRGGGTINPSYHLA